MTGSDLIRPDEPAAFDLIEGAAGSRLIIVCDHASNRIPAALGSLGVDRHRLTEHIAWDIGAAGVARRLQARFGADAILANYSRLVIDLNRRPGDFTVIPPISDGLLIPGNLGLSPEARDLRGRLLHAPYHQAIEALIARREGGGEMPVFVGIHSFTPRIHGTDRPWHAGILWDRDPRLSLPLLSALRRHREVFVGDNEPYSGRHTADYTIDTHAEVRGMAHAGIEIRQDLIADEDGQARWATLIGDALEPLLDDHRVLTPLSPVTPMP